MGKKVKRPSWFKLFLSQKALIDSVPDSEVGQALKAAYLYFESKEIPELPPLAFAVFSTLKPSIDESYEDFEAACKKNSENIKKRWALRGNQSLPVDTSGNQSLPVDTSGNQSLPVDTSGYHMIPSDTEAEAEADTPLTGGVDASIASGNIKIGEPPLCGGGPPTPLFYEPPIYYDEKLGRYVDRRDSEK